MRPEACVREVGVGNGGAVRVYRHGLNLTCQFRQFRVRLLVNLAHQRVRFRLRSPRPAFAPTTS